ncbi:4621_t:CDS:1, partial [Cetraspora pellucida]
VSPYYSALPISNTSSLTTPMNNSNNRGVPQQPALVTPSPTRNIANLMRRMSHDSPANTSQYPQSTYHYAGYPPQSSTQSLPTTPVTTLPSMQGISFNPSVISNAAHSTMAAALNYARRASVVLPQLPRNLGGIHSSVPSPVSTVAPDNMGPGLVRRGSYPTVLNGSSLSNGNNNNGSGNGSIHSEPRSSSSNIVMNNGSSSAQTSVSSNPVMVNGHGQTSGIGNIFHKITKRGSW